MFHRSAFKQRLLCQVISAGLLTTAATSALAGDFVLVGNQISWTKGAVTGTATIGSGGNASTINLVNTNDANTLPNVSFSLEDYATSTDTYSLGLYMEVNSDSNDNQVEMSLGTVRVTTVNGSITSVAMVTNTGDDHYRPVEVNAQKVGSGSTINLSASFAAKANMISNPGTDPNKVTIQVDNVIAALSGNNGLFDDIIERFASNGDYSYHIGIQFLDAANNTVTSAELGTYDDNNDFTASAVGAPAITLGTPNLSAKFPSASFISGEFNIVDTLPDTGGSTGGGSTGGGSGSGGETVVDDQTLDDIDEDNAALDNAVNEALNSGGEISQEVVDQAKEAIQQSSDAIKQITDVIKEGGTVDQGNLLQAAQKISATVKTAVTVINNSDSDGTGDVEANTREAVNNLVDAIQNLQDREVELNDVEKEVFDNVLKDLAPAVSGLTEKTQTEEDLESEAEKLKKLTAANNALGVVASEESRKAVEDASRAIQKRLLALKTGEPVSDEDVKDNFEGNEEFREAAVENAPDRPNQGNVPPSEVTFSGDWGALLNNANSDALDKLRKAIAKALSKVVNVNEEFISILNLTVGVKAPDLSTEQTSPAQRAILAASDSEDAFNLAVDEQTGLITVTLPGEKYTAQLVSSKSVPVTDQPAFYFRPNGNALLVGNGVAYELAPSPVSLPAFVNAALEMSFDSTQRDNGSFYLTLSETDRFSGTFAYDNLTGLSPENCGNVSFAAPTTEVNAADYAFTMTCADNAINQRIVPFVDAEDFRASVAGFDLSVSIDRNTGFITIAGIGKLKPSFFVTSANAAETAFHEANKDSFGLAYMGEDVNGDGKLDYKVISDTGVQVLYAAD